MSDARPMAKPSPRTRAISLGLAACFTAGLFWYLLATTTWADWTALWAGMDRGLLLIYFGMFLGVMLLRAARYRMLLKASAGPAAPGLMDLTTLTFVSNLFVDLLPARSGSLAYVVFLNQKLDVQLAACFSSFAFSFIFDMIGMLPLFFLAVLGAQSGGALSGPWLWAALGGLAVGSLLALLLIDRLLGLAARVVSNLAGRPGQAPASRLALALSRVGRELEAVARDMAQVKAQGVFWPVLGVSVLIRLGKYFSLYLLILAVASQWGPDTTARLGLGVVLLSLVTAEATASLPISGLAGFGAYEGVMMFVLRQAGLEPVQAAMLPVTLHLITQTIDYCMGGAALLRLMAVGRARGNG